MLNKKTPRKLFFNLILILFASLIFSNQSILFSRGDLIPVDSPTESYLIYQITDDDSHDEGSWISNGQIAFLKYVGNDNEVFLYDGSTVTQITDNDVIDGGVDFDDGQIAWLEYDDLNDNADVMFYDGSTVIQLTDNDYDDANPQISNGQIAWHGLHGAEREIFLYNGSTVTQLTVNAYVDTDPQISNGQVTWAGNDGDGYEIFLFNGSTVTQITDNDYGASEPQISNGWITWAWWGGGDAEIFLYNGSTITQITDNDYDDYAPEIDDGQITWMGMVGGSDREIFLYNGSTITQLTDNSHDDWDPQISNGQLTWSMHDGNDMEVFVYNGSTVIQLTDNFLLDDQAPQISNGQVTWSRVNWDFYASEIFLAVENPYAGLDSFELNFVPGWNMVSLPLLPDDPSASSVLSDIGYYQLITWSGTGYTTATEFETGRGYWLLVLEETNVTIYGNPVESLNITLSPGWSMIGGTNSSVQAVQVFPAYYQLVTWTGTGYTSAAVYEPGKGYWALVLEETQITLP